MFSFLFDPTAFFQRLKNQFADKIYSILKGKEPKEIVDETKERAMKLATDESYANAENINRILKERQKKIDEARQPQEEIYKAKQEFKMRMYKATMQKKGQGKNRDFEKSR